MLPFLINQSFPSEEQSRKQALATSVLPFLNNQSFPSDEESRKHPLATPVLPFLISQSFPSEEQSRKQALATSTLPFLINQSFPFEERTLSLLKRELSSSPVAVRPNSSHPIPKLKCTKKFPPPPPSAIRLWNNTTPQEPAADSPQAFRSTTEVWLRNDSYA